MMRTYDVYYGQEHHVSCVSMMMARKPGSFHLNGRISGSRTSKRESSKPLISGATMTNLPSKKYTRLAAAAIA